MFEFWRAGVTAVTVAPAGLPTDAQVIAASEVEPERFAVLYDRYAAGLYRYADRRVGPAHAEDVVAETFAVAFRRRASYDRTRPYARPWLYGIATKEIARWHRAEATRLRAWERGAFGNGDEPLADRVADRVSAGAAGPALASALQRLAPGERDVLLLAAWGDLTQAQIAETLGIRPGTARSRLHRARKTVRAVLGPGVWDDGEAGR